MSSRTAARYSLPALFLASTAMAAPVWAGEVPLVAPPPEWVIPAPEPGAPDAAANPDNVVLFDQQVLMDGDLDARYLDYAQTIANPDQLTKEGNLSLSWQPDRGDLILHRLEIMRGAERIDLLKAGPGFTVLRRENGLERLIIDGMLTANRQIEGLRLGDTLRVSFSITDRDRLLGGRGQSSMILLAKPARLGFGRARLVWPAGQQLAWKAMMPGIAATPKAISGGRKELVVAMPVEALPEVPRDAPARFRPVPAIVASSFTGWDEVARIMAPLFRTEGTIAEGSDLAKAVDAIAAAHADPLERTAAALRMVQNDVRYLLVALGTGNYKPQSPDQTWRGRYGDCKAKTLLLLAALHRMGIKAEAVLANSRNGDLVPAMVPAAQAFDHVFVRAEIGGESLWLDGTMMGARLADIRDIPRMGHVLPLREEGAGLVRLEARADARPSPEVELTYDASAGVHLPTPIRLSVRYVGASGERMRALEAAGSAEGLLEQAEKFAKTWTGSTSILKPVTRFDPADASWTMTMEGVAFPEWEYVDGRLELTKESAIRVDFKPDRSRSIWQGLPALIDNPWTARSRTRMILPVAAAAATVEGDEPVALAMPAIEYRRSISREGNTLIEEVISRESGAEVAAGDISNTRRAITDASAKVLRIRLPADYPFRWQEITRSESRPAVARIRALFDRRIAEKPGDADRLAERGWLATRLLEWASAEDFYSRALALDPTAERYSRRSGIRSVRGDRVGAMKDAQAAYDLDPGNKDLRAQLSGELADAGNIDQALDLLEPDPDVATDDGQESLLHRAEVLTQGGRSNDALALLDAALRKRPSSPPLLNGRCWFKALANVDLDGALADCTRGIELSAQPAAYLDSRAMVHFRAGRFGAALTDIDAALAINPEQAASHFLRGLIQQRNGDGKGGAPDFAAARTLSPSIDNFYARYGIRPK